MPKELFQRAPRPEEIRLAAEFYNAKVIADRQTTGARATAQQTAEDIRLNRRLKQQQKQLNKPGRKKNAKQGIQNEGDFVERRPLTVWEEYAQALLFTNEIAYVN